MTLPPPCRHQQSGHSHPHHTHLLLLHSAVRVVLNDLRKWRVGEYIMICKDLAMKPKLYSFREIYSPWASQIWPFCYKEIKTSSFLHWCMLEKTVNQPTANSSERVCYIPDVEVVTEATHFGNTAHNMAVMNLLCWAFVLDAFLKVSSIC